MMNFTAMASREWVGEEGAAFIAQMYEAACLVNVAERQTKPPSASITVFADGNGEIEFSNGLYSNRYTFRISKRTDSVLINFSTDSMKTEDGE